MIHPFSHRSSLQSVRDSISNQVSAVVHLYEQNADILDLLTVTERSATGPSVSDMMGWLHDAERHFRQQYPLCYCSLFEFDLHYVLGSFFSLTLVQISEEEDFAADSEAR